MIHSANLPLPDFRRLGARMPRQRGQRGQLKKIRSGGKTVWWGRWYVYAKQPDGSEKRLPREKIIGPASMTRFDAQTELTRQIERTTGQLPEMPARPTVAEAWRHYVTMKTPLWSTANRKNVEQQFAKHVIPLIGGRELSMLTLEPLQTVLNRMAEQGYRRSGLHIVSTYIKALMAFCLDENLIERDPARKLVIPTRLKRSSERVLSMDEARRLWSAAGTMTEATETDKAGRERRYQLDPVREQLIVRMFLVCAFRPQELFALRADDIEPGRVRIDEALKERERGEYRIGDTKTEGSHGYVTVTPEIEADLRAWVQARGIGQGALLFPTGMGTPWRHANYLRRVLQPLARAVGIKGVTFQALRRTCATHFKAREKNKQEHLRHTSPVTTMKHYDKPISAEVRLAVEQLDRELTATGKPLGSVQ